MARKANWFNPNVPLPREASGGDVVAEKAKADKARAQARGRPVRVWDAKTRKLQRTTFQ